MRRITPLSKRLFWVGSGFNLLIGNLSDLLYEFTTKSIDIIFQFYIISKSVIFIKKLNHFDLQF